MSDGWAVLMAAVAAAGALVAAPIPLPAAVLLGLAAYLLRKPVLLCAAVGLAASSLSARAHDGLTVPEGRVTLEGRATLLTDPAAALHSAVKVELRLDGRHIEAFAHGAGAAALRPMLAGQTISVAGTAKAVTGKRRAYLASRHIALQLSIAKATDPRPGGPVARATNAVRTILVRGTAAMAKDQQAMFAGFVLGDGRDEPPATVDDFRQSGLTHLLVVSGENVAFVLALAAVPLRFLGLRGRLIGGLAVLVFFGALTRWEPSVLRAEAMAGVALLATYLGRPASTVRLLALAVAGLILVDPLLIRSVGFGLSVGACTGIALLAGPLTRRLRLPLPLASRPANLLAVPAAGPLTMWGMAAGIPAGLAGGRWAAALHAPTVMLMAWIERVAHWAARLSWPNL